MCTNLVTRWNAIPATILRTWPKPFPTLLTSASLLTFLLLLSPRAAVAQCEQAEARPGHHGAPNNVALELNSAQSQTVNVQISGPGIAKPMESRLCAGQGAQGAGFYVPPGEDRQIELSVLDSQGNVAYRGEATLSVKPGPLASTIVPLATVRSGESLHATIGTYRVAVKQDPSKDGKSATERVEVLDPEGKPVPIRADQITLRAAGETITPLHPAPAPGPADHLNINNFPRIGPNTPIIICFVNLTCGPIIQPPLFFLPGPFQAVTAGGLQGVPGFQFTCAIDTNGQAWCWGADDIGELATTVATSSTCASVFPCSLVPLPVEQNKITFKSGPGNPPMPENVLTAGIDFACALDTTGAAWCWGGGQRENFGELGVTGGPLPVQVGGTPFATAHKFLSLSAGGNHACGITTEHTLFCWGRNTSGELGINSTNPAGPPTQVNIPNENVVNQVAAGDFHTCAIAGDAKMFCWGDDETGELGINFTTTATARCPANPGGTQFCELTPVEVQFQGSKASGLWDRVSAGNFFTCGRDQQSQQLFCWGSDALGQLGIGPTTAGFNPGFNPSPLAVSSPVTLNLIASHADQSCGVPFVVSGPDNLFCWGTGISSPAVLVPTSIPNHAFLFFAPGGPQTCAVDTNDAAWCWGDNSMGELGNGTTTSSTTPVKVVP